VILLFYSLVNIFIIIIIIKKYRFMSNRVQSLFISRLIDLF